MQVFPSTRYHPTLAPRAVHTTDEHDALAVEGWKESPAEFDASGYVDFPATDSTDASEIAATAAADTWQPPAEMEDAAETDEAAGRRILAADHAVRVNAPPKRKRP